MPQHLDRRGRRWPRFSVGDEGERTERGGESEFDVFCLDTQSASVKSWHACERRHRLMLFVCLQDVRTGTEGAFALVLSTDNGVLCKFSLGSNVTRMEYQLYVDLESGSIIPFRWLASDPSNPTPPAQVNLQTAPASEGLKNQIAPTMPTEFETGDHSTRLGYTSDLSVESKFKAALNLLPTSIFLLAHDTHASHSNVEFEFETALEVGISCRPAGALHAKQQNELGCDP